MKKVIKILGVLIISWLALSSFYSCSNNGEKMVNNTQLNQQDKEALLFMLEEEKLARDTYTYLDNLWSLTPFTNIKVSEQSHMNAVSNVLDMYNISYTVLEDGKFKNPDLQNLYDELIEKGSVSTVDALKVGALIEDLDIVDLQERIDVTDNTTVINVFSSLQCGSRNHLRAFINTLTNNGETYSPAYITQEEFNTIINQDNEQCN